MHGWMDGLGWCQGVVYLVAQVVYQLFDSIELMRLMINDPFVTANPICIVDYDLKPLQLGQGFQIIIKIISGY